jgi:hypothetical protein
LLGHGSQIFALNGATMPCDFVVEAIWLEVDGTMMHVQSPTKDASVICHLGQNTKQLRTLG